MALRGAWDACRRHMVPVGMAPNIEVYELNPPANAFRTPWPRDEMPLLARSDRVELQT